MICIFLFSCGACISSIVTGQYAADPLAHVVEVQRACIEASPVNLIEYLQDTHQRARSRIIAKSSSAHPSEPNLIPTTRPFLPHSPILWFSLAYLRAVRCKCQRVALACWGPCSVESQRPCPTQENLLLLWVGSRSAMDTSLR